jgi:glycosyltransferase involved in cell wall biosynthesis
VVTDEAALLREAGDEVKLFSPRPAADGAVRTAQLGGQAVWSQRAYRVVRTMVRDFSPDVVHVHNLFPGLSPSVLRATGVVPVVMTLHNYRLMCLPATFFRDGKICMDCANTAPWRGVVHRCYRGSALASSSVAASLIAHRTMGTFRKVRRFLAVSEDVKRRHVEFGFPDEQLIVKPNFSWATTRRTELGDAFLYAGRLDVTKGLSTLFDAWSRMERRGGRLLIAGDGPARARLERGSDPSIRFLGAIPPNELADLVGAARAVVIPSLWFEGSPRTVTEAYAAGVPVIASRIGALEETVRHELTGLLVPPGDASALAEAMGRVCAREENLRLGAGAYNEWVTRYSPKVGLASLHAAYVEAATTYDSDRRPSC